jgi:predicted aminopeptidase
VAQKLEQRATVFREWAAHYRAEVAPRLKTVGFRGYADQPLNNARLIGTRLYYQRLDLFEAVFEKYGRDLRAATHAIMDAARRQPDDPWAAVEGLLR